LQTFFLEQTRGMSNEPTITLRPAQVARWLGVMIAILLPAQILAQVFKYMLGRNMVYGFVPLFNMNTEATLPAYYSALLLLTSAVLLGFIARWSRAQQKPFARHWKLLAYIFLFLSVDEACLLHEKIGFNLMRFARFSELDGLFHYVWVIPYLILAVVVATFYIPFLRHLPSRLSTLFVVAGVIYVTGAIGMEMVYGLYIKGSAQENQFASGLLSTVEETMEIVGISVFVYALLKYIAMSGVNTWVRIAEGNRYVAKSPPGKPHAGSGPWSVPDSLP